MCLADSDKFKKLTDQNAKLKEDLKKMANELELAKLNLTKTEGELTNALGKMEIAAAAAVGDIQKLMGEKITEAYKEGQRDAQRFLKEMRSMF